MNFKPTYTHHFGNKWLFWFKNSNRYSFVDPILKQATAVYFDAVSYDAFHEQIQQLKRLNADETAELFHQIEAYLTHSNTSIASTHEFSDPLPFDPVCCDLTIYYLVNGRSFQVNYDSSFTFDLLHHPLAHYETGKTPQKHSSYFVYCKNEHIYLYKEEQLLTCVAKEYYHYIQGKFSMHVLCEIHAIPESDWVGTLHASTVAYNNKAVMLIGDSGSGKSTLTAILAASGFELVADDISPIHETTAAVHYNPSGVSIKAGAFKFLSHYYPSLSSLPTCTSTVHKGPIKYLPLPLPKRMHYKCSYMLLVDYAPNATTELTELPADQALSILIPESWLSATSRHAKFFIDWLDTIQFYKLSYSDNNAALACVKKLLDQTAT